jgi:hypothetical protein
MYKCMLVESDVDASGTLNHRFSLMCSFVNPSSPFATLPL